MATVKIIVPHGQFASEVTIDAMPAQRMTTETHPGFGYDVETWAATSNGPTPRVLTVVFSSR